MNLSPSHHSESEACEDLLQQELSALECCERALQLNPDEPVHAVLAAVRFKHGRNIGCLFTHLVREDADWAGSLPHASAPRTDCSQGDLMSLESFEAETWRHYLAVLAMPEVSEGLRRDIRGRLIPRLEANIGELSRVRVLGEGGIDPAVVPPTDLPD